MRRWRPEGWKNPYTVNPQAKDYPKNAFEQGANAMLVGVCEEIGKMVLTDEERKPYLAIDKCQVTDHFAGVYDAEFEIWEITRLLQAQLQKVLTLLRSEK